MATARAFWDGDSQVVLLPEDIRFDTDEVEVFRRGEELILVEKPRNPPRPEER